MVSYDDAHDGTDYRRERMKGMRQLAAAYGSLGLSTQRQREVTDTVRTIQRLVNAVTVEMYGSLLMVAW
jgi:hypothetical protein